MGNPIWGLHTGFYTGYLGNMEELCGGMEKKTGTNNCLGFRDIWAITASMENQMEGEMGKSVWSSGSEGIGGS